MQRTQDGSSYGYFNEARTEAEYRGQQRRGRVSDSLGGH